MPKQATRNVEKLPKWAQDRIRVLEMRVAEAAAREATGPEDSNTFANPYGDMTEGSAATPLGKDELIRFVIDGDKRKHFDVRLDGHELQVHGSWGLVLRGSSTNLFYMELDRR